MGDSSWMTTVVWYAGRLLWMAGLMGGGIVALLWYFQEKLLFHPGAPPGFKTPDKNPSGLKHPGEQNMEYEDVTIATEDGVSLHAWFIKQSAEGHTTAPTLLFFQGNAGNMGFRIPNLRYLYEIVKVNILAVSYRGYGWSSGTPTEQGLYRDARASLSYLSRRADVDKNKLFVFGRSVGGAIAIDLAAREFPTLRGMIVENTFTNLQEMGELVFPIFRSVRPLIRYVQRLTMDNKAKVQTLQIPSLFISGLQDTLVPPQHMMQLYEACSSKLKHMHSVATGTHNETWQLGGHEYYKKIREFIENSLTEHARGGLSPLEVKAKTTITHRSSVTEKEGGEVVEASEDVCSVEYSLRSLREDRTDEETGRHRRNVMSEETAERKLE